MVIQDKKCETSAIPEGTEVSLPNAAGITMELSPKGIEREQTAQMYAVLSMEIKCAAKIKMNGIIRSLTIVTA